MHTLSWIEIEINVFFKNLKWGILIPKMSNCWSNFPESLLIFLRTPGWWWWWWDSWPLSFSCWFQPSVKECHSLEIRNDSRWGIMQRYCQQNLAVEHANQIKIQFLPPFNSPALCLNLNHLVWRCLLSFETEMFTF